MKKFYLPKPSFRKAFYLALTDAIVIVGCAGALAALWFWLFCVRCC